MILVDASLLLYAKFADFPQHPAAGTWLDEKINGPHRVGLPWESLVAFMRLATNRRVFATPLSSTAAWEQIAQWLAQPPVWVPLPTEAHGATMAALVEASRPTAKLVPDAHLAALAVEHGLVLCTTDGDFARFPNLRWENPLRIRPDA